MPFSLKDKVVMITGAAGGIGMETARTCSALRAKKLVLLDLNEPVDLIAELDEQNIQTRFLQVDVRDSKALENIVSDLPRIDALIANAGYCPWDDWNDPGWDDVFKATVDIIALGVINTVRPVFNKMVEQGSGRIVIVSSVAGRMGGLKASPHYVIAKSGLHGFVKWLAQKGAKHEVLVNAVAHGVTATKMIAEQDFDERTVPMGRLARPREIALPIAFLCSDAASYICGTVLDVNGGVYMN